MQEGGMFEVQNTGGCVSVVFGGEVIDIRSVPKYHWVEDGNLQLECIETGEDLAFVAKRCFI